MQPLVRNDVVGGGCQDHPEISSVVRMIRRMGLQRTAQEREGSHDNSAASGVLIGGYQVEIPGRGTDVVGESLADKGTPDLAQT